MKATVGVLFLLLLSSTALADRVGVHRATIGWLDADSAWSLIEPPDGFVELGRLIVVRLTDANRLQGLDKTKRYSCSLRIDPAVYLSPTVYMLFGISGCVAAPPSCTDRLRNQDETDIDCGGSCPLKCGDFKTCSVSTDCNSGLCQVLSHSLSCHYSPDIVNGTKVCSRAHCVNGVQDAEEAGVDCGQDCPVGCESGAVCNGTNCDCALGLDCIFPGNTCE